MSQTKLPMHLFPGFYSQYAHDELPVQRICYMNPISAPSTRNDVVRETMTRSMNIANKTGQEYGVVTYDLTVALKAYSIQASEAPLYRDVKKTFFFRLFFFFIVFFVFFFVFAVDKTKKSLFLK